MSIFSNINWEKILKKSGRIGEITLAVGLAILILYAIIYFSVGGNPLTKEYKKQSKEIKSSIDSIKKEQQFIIERMYFVEKNIQQYQEEDRKIAEEIKKEISKQSEINKIYYEKIKNANRYTPHQLDSFFRTNYKEYYSK